MSLKYIIFSGVVELMGVVGSRRRRGRSSRGVERWKMSLEISATAPKNSNLDQLS